MSRVLFFVTSEPCVLCSSVLGNYFNHHILFLEARACPLTAALEGLLQTLLFLSLRQLADQISGIDTYLTTIIYVGVKFIQ